MPAAVERALAAGAGAAEAGPTELAARNRWLARVMPRLLERLSDALVGRDEPEGRDALAREGDFAALRTALTALQAEIRRHLPALAPAVDAQVGRLLGRLLVGRQLATLGRGPAEDPADLNRAALVRAGQDVARDVRLPWALGWAARLLELEQEPSAAELREVLEVLSAQPAGPAGIELVPPDAARLSQGRRLLGSQLPRQAWESFDGRARRELLPAWEAEDRDRRLELAARSLLVSWAAAWACGLEREPRALAWLWRERVLPNLPGVAIELQRALVTGLARAASQTGELALAAGLQGFADVALGWERALRLAPAASTASEELAWSSGWEAPSSAARQAARRALQALCSELLLLSSACEPTPGELQRVTAALECSGLDPSQLGALLEGLCDSLLELPGSRALLDLLDEVARLVALRSVTSSQVAAATP